MPINGSIEEAGLPDVLQLLSLGKKTGCLAMVDGALHGEIYLDAGRISYANVANRLDRIGDVLVKLGRITQEHLKEAVDEQARGNKRQLGRILVDFGRIEHGELERFVRLQVEEAVYFLFTWKQGTFSFTSSQRPPHDPLPESLDAQSLLLEGARRVDEWTLIQKKIPSFDLVYQRTKDKLNGEAAEDLTYPQQRILPLLDGTRDVAGLIDVTAMSEFDVGKALYGLVMAGFARLVERRAHARHLDYRDLLAYVVREAEFADAQRRKDAGRHIVDCPTCAARLRKIQVRQTEGSGVLAPPAVAPETPVETEPVELAPQPAPPLVQHAAAAPPGLPERIARGRRTGRDRRQFERRCNLDRRRAVNAAWLQSNVDRRASHARDRRSGDSQRRAGEVTLAAPAVRSGGVGERITGPRMLAPLELVDHGRSHMAAAPAADDLAMLEIAPYAAAVGVSEPAVEAAAPTPAAPTSPPDAAAPATRVSPPAAKREGALSKEIVWVTSPEESLELYRASRSQMRAMAAAAPAPAETPAAAAAAKPAGGLQPSGSNGRSAVASPVAARPAGGEKLAGQPVVRRPLPLRPLGIAAGIASVALIGYLAGQLGRDGRSGQVAETTAANALPATAAAQPAPRTRPPAGGPTVPSRAAPMQPAPGTAAPAQQRALSQPAAVAPPRPAAEPRPVPQEVAQRAAPVPVTAVAQPPAAPVAAPRVETPPPQPAPTVGTIRGVVRDASGRTLAGARVSVRGTTLAAVADGSGAYEIQNVPDGPVLVQAAAEGYVAGNADVRARAGATVAADLSLSRAPTAAEPDRELAAGGWAPVDRAEATSTLGGTLGAIEGLTIESITRSTAGTRPRVRVVQLTPSGERIVLTETRAGAAVRGGAGPAVVTALRVMPPSEAYPFSTGTASLGNLLITVRSSLAADALRGLLERLGEVR